MNKEGLLTGGEKVQKIATELRHGIIEPAQAEAKRIVEDAQAQAERLLHTAKEQAEQTVQKAHQTVERERLIFNSSIEQAAKQSVETLRQAIEHKLLHPELNQLIEKEMKRPQLIAELISAIIKGIEKEGIESDLIAYIPANIDPTEVNRYLSSEIIQRLKHSTVELGDFTGGAKLRVENRKLVIELTNREVVELIARYVRKDFRKLFFTE